MVHWGTVGDRGQSRKVKVNFWQKPDTVVEKELSAARNEGYREINADDEISILAQYQIDGFGNENDLNKRHEIENIFNEALGWTGNGICDGGATGSGTMEIFSCVVDEEQALKTIRDALENRGFLDGAVIAARRQDEDFRVLYPADHESMFEE